MKSRIKDKVEGTFHEVKGQVKKSTGKLFNKPEMEAKGSSEKLAGQAQRKVGQVKKAFED